MVKTFFLALFLFSVTHASGEMISSPEHDFGKIPARKSFSHVFTIENKGAGPLHLESIEHG